MPRLQVTVTGDLLRSIARGIGDKEIGKTIERAAGAVILQAAKDFVNHLAQNVPVLTGESLASVLPVARAIRASRDIGRRLRGAGTRPAARGRDRTGIGESKGGGGLELANGKWTFTFTTNVAHFVFRENRVVVTDVNPQLQTPWHVIKQADKIMRKRISANLSKAMRTAISKSLGLGLSGTAAEIDTSGTDII